MKVYIQSKSGDYNSEVELETDELKFAMKFLRADGGYYVAETQYRTERFVPFEEIEHIEKVL